MNQSLLNISFNWTVIWDMLNKTAIIIGLITFIFSFLIWIKVRQQQKKIKKLIYALTPVRDYKTFYEEFEQIKTAYPAALCISLLIGTDSIKKTVNDFLESNSLNVNRIEEIKMDGINNKEDIEGYINRLREMRKGPLSEASEIRLFIAGPVQAGTLAGAVFDNWIPVLLYHKGNAGYEYWGPLLKN